MMDIRTYFYDVATEEEQDEIISVYENDDIDFNAYCVERNIDLTIVDDRMGETILTLWAWDICGE